MKHTHTMTLQLGAKCPLQPNTTMDVGLEIYNMRLPKEWIPWFQGGEFNWPRAN